MFKRCSTCKHRCIDMKALMLCVYIFKCDKKGHFVTNPFWKGWGCDEWEKEDGK